MMSDALLRICGHLICNKQNNDDKQTKNSQLASGHFVPKIAVVTVPLLVRDLLQRHLANENEHPVNNSILFWSE